MPSPLAGPERADNALIHLTHGAWSSRGFLILDDERNVTAEGLKGEHVRGGRAGVSLTLFRSTGTLSPRGGSPQTALSPTGPSHTILHAAATGIF